ncbi:MAG: MFS transporter [Desulfobulbaceae bacterium]|nr:MFS transporter [Desulfobulbaceae bacterium]
MSREGLERFWILTAAALNIFVLYSPQPLLPLYADLFKLSEPTAGLIMTATMLPLAVAPLSYGFILSYIPTLRLLRASLLLLAVFTGLTALVQTFPQMLAVRFLQGMIIPASLTAVMAFLAQPGRSPDWNLQRRMSLYVAATISGGFLGRLLAGASSTVVDWRLYFLALAVLLLACFFMVGSTTTASEVARKGAPVEANPASMDVFTLCLPVYLAVFLMFFVFCGILNYLPFRTIELSGSMSGLLTGSMYAGYVSGIITSMGAGKIIRRVGSEAKVMCGAYLVFLLFLFAMLLPLTWALFLLLFPFCGAMFLVHCVATAVVNGRAGNRRGLASGIYVASYYGGGVVGTYVPGLIFKGSGWTAMVFVLLAAGVAGLAMLVFFFRGGRGG